MSIRRLLVLTALTTFAACGGDDPVDPGNGTPTVASVTVSTGTAQVEAGQTAQFSAVARDSNGGTVTGASVSWSSSDTQIATIDVNGLATGLAAGTTSITATVSGVAGSKVLTVVPDECQAAQTVQIAAGETATFSASGCLRLPAGVSGDRYRVAFVRASEAGNPNDVITASVHTTAVASLASPSQRLQADAAPPPAEHDIDLPGVIDGEVLVRNMALQQRTRRFHQKLRAEERLLGFGEGLLPDRPLLTAAQRVDPPASMSFNASFQCSGSPQPAQLIVFNDDVAIYQDSTERAGSPISNSAATRLRDYYTNYVKDMLVQYWGPLSDIDQNGRLLVTTSPTLADTVAGAVWSGDLSTTGVCNRGNQAELVYLSGDLVSEMDNVSSPNFASLGTLAHEAKHVVSLRHRILAAESQGGTAALFHPLWYEEGQAEIAESTTSRIAWAATGGPALGTPITGTHIITAVGANNGRQTAEMWGIVEKLANVIVNQSTHPNSVITNPVGANEFHSFYAGSWHLQRFLGDAYGGAATPGADAPMFLRLNDASTLTGSARLTQETGQTFNQHIEELAIGAMFSGTTAPAPAKAFTTIDWATATDIFTGPPVLAPAGRYPWPVTQSGTNPSASFTTATYSGVMGPASFRIHDFLSSGSGTALQLEFSGDPNARIIVARIR